VIEKDIDDESMSMLSTDAESFIGRAVSGTENGYPSKGAKDSTASTDDLTSSQEYLITEIDDTEDISDTASRDLS